MAEIIQVVKAVNLSLDSVGFRIPTAELKKGRVKKGGRYLMMVDSKNRIIFEPVENIEVSEE